MLGISAPFGERRSLQTLKEAHGVLPDLLDGRLSIAVFNKQWAPQSHSGNGRCTTREEVMAAFREAFDRVPDNTVDKSS